MFERAGDHRRARVDRDRRRRASAAGERSARGSADAARGAEASVGGTAREEARPPKHPKPPVFIAPTPIPYMLGGDIESVRVAPKIVRERQA
jgi:hypothetical protein